MSKYNLTTKKRFCNPAFVKYIKMIITIIIFIILTPILLGNSDNYYKMDGKITAVNFDEVICEDTTGNVWSFFAEDGYKTGQKVIITFYDNETTATRKDDYIENVKIIKNKKF